ncbi:MAG: conjugal transfer protein TraH, partial [Rickettsiaceae bacterium]|nr:conjugal transfer protein TraH [Rickettsiaceae bacterium]
INKGKVVSDQQAGYVTGGSIISRGPKPETLRPLIVQPPSFEFDPCSGSYDARFGVLVLSRAKLLVVLSKLFQVQLVHMHSRC